MNKKADLTMNLMFLLLATIIVLMILLAVNSVLNEKICKQECGGAIESETKGEGNMLEALTQRDELNCICYYENSIKTKRVRE